MIRKALNETPRQNCKSRKRTVYLVNESRIYMNTLLINPLSPPPGFNLTLEVIDKYTGWGDERVFAFKNGTTVVICRLVVTASSSEVAQIELPTSSIAWFIDTVEQGFWGGKLDRRTHQASRSFDEEEILITRQQNAGTNIPGFSIRNLARVVHEFSDMAQVIQLCDPFLKESLLPELKRHFGHNGI